MDLYYEGKKISLNISKCIITDNIQCKADSIFVSFADIKNECRTWDFKKGDTIKIVNSNYSTGIMFVDNYGFCDGLYNIKALSIKKKFKSKRTRSWENVTFLDIAKDLTDGLGLNLETYGIENFRYKRVDQIEINNLEFLKNRCILEGYILKITDNKAVIISEIYLENQKPVLTLEPSDFIGKPKFECTSNNIYGGCHICFDETEYIEGEYILDNSNDDILYINTIPAYSIGEAQRFSKNILRNFNKSEITGTFTISENTNIAAGSTIKLDGLFLFSGKYIIENITTSKLEGKTKVKVRKVLEGY